MKSDFPTGVKYTPYYCEENIWLLCREPAFADRPRWVLVISNPGRCCAVWHQRASQRHEDPICWDYHVVLAVYRAAVWEIWDLDTRLGMPVPAVEWLTRSFPALHGEYARFAPRFRVIESEAYLARFSSDRSHMRGDDGSWRQPPPPWPTIEVADAPSFLGWTEMAESDGDCLDLDQLRAVLSAPPDDQGHGDDEGDSDGELADEPAD